MKLLLLGVVSPTAAAWVLGQTAEFDPLSLLGQIGLGAVFAIPWFYLWRDERKQRIDAEKREREQAQLTIPLLARSVEVLDTVAHGVGQTVERAAQAMPNKTDMDLTMRRVELLMGELGDLATVLKRGLPEGK